MQRGLSNSITGSSVFCSSQTWEGPLQLVASCGGSPAVSGLTILWLFQVTLVSRIGWTSLSHGHLFCCHLLDATIWICDSKNRLLVKLRCGLIVGLNHFGLYFSLLFPRKMVTVIALGLEFVFPPWF